MTPEALLLRGPVQQLADVGQVGEQPLAALLGEHPRGEPPPLARHRAPRRRRAVRNRSSQLRTRSASVVGQVVAAGEQVVGVVAKNGVSAAARIAAGQLRLLHRLEQPQPVRGRPG